MEFKDKRFRKVEFVAKTQFLCNFPYGNFPKVGCNEGPGTAARMG